MAKELNVGIEIEGLVNSNLFCLAVGEYHEGEFFGLSGWDAEQDSSICPSNNLHIIAQEEIEFVSKIFKGKKKFFKGIEDFIDFFSKKGKHELYEVMFFNYSCGSHLHFSFSEDNLKEHKFYKKTYYKIFEKMRKQFINKIKKSKIKSKQEIIKNYFRGYASNVLRLGNYNNWKDERQAEFNILSEQRDEGIEWRSLNLRGVETWEEFREFWKIVYNCLEKFSEYSLKYSVKDKFVLIGDAELSLLNKKYKNNKTESNSYLEGISKKKRYSHLKIELSENQIKENDFISFSEPINKEDLKIEYV